MEFVRCVIDGFSRESKMRTRCARGAMGMGIGVNGDPIRRFGIEMGKPSLTRHTTANR